MAPRRHSDDDNENWKDGRAADIEKLFRWAIGIIGLLILIVCSLAWNTVLEIKKINLDNQVLITGNARTIDGIRKEFDAHEKLHSVVWTQEEKDEYKEIKKEVYRKWGYLTATRSGEEILHDKPIKGLN